MSLGSLSQFSKAIHSLKKGPGRLLLAAAERSNGSNDGYEIADIASMMGVGKASKDGPIGAGGPAAEGGMSLQDMQGLQGLMSLMQNQKAQQQAPAIREDDFRAPDLGAYMGAATVPSSRSLKAARSRGLADALDRGLSGEDPIDANGVEVVAIKALDKRIADLTRRAEAVARRKGAQR